jgi:SAM-dependent methyltransferase
MEPSFYEDYYHHENNHWWFRWRFDLITRLVRSLGSGDDFRILDAGCGTGQMTKRLGAIGTAYGLDSAPEAIAFARSRGVERLAQGSITAPPFATGAFDCVLALDVIEHVDDDFGILTSLLKILRPGGHLIVTVPAFDALWSEHDEINHHKRRYRAPQLRTLIENAGFEIDRVTYCNTATYVPVLVTRKAKNLVRSLNIRRGGEPSTELQSDLGDYHPVVNEALFNVMLGENRLLDRMNLPFGVSILAVAKRPLAAANAPTPTEGRAWPDSVAVNSSGHSFDRGGAIAAVSRLADLNARGNS